MERETGFEPATSTLARLHSTTELFPLVKADIRYFTLNLSIEKVFSETPGLTIEICLNPL